MNHSHRILHRSIVIFIFGLALSGLILTTTGCSGPSHLLDAGLSGPQLVVNPDTIRLGVAKVMKTVVVFEGMGFEPEEKVMVVLAGTETANREVVVPMGFGVADPQGRFTIEVEKTMKIYNLLNADVTFGDKGAIVLVSDPPVPTGVYEAKATGYQSSRSATCRLTLVPPSFIDRIKDRIARMLGKIEME
ncbi:MAG: hypothetical protein JEZ11_27715 [Desulfobacterales bacterium]|nr:hypothetical protein [Desulfobacterales bacterium]